MIDRPALARKFHGMFRESATYGQQGKGVSRVALSAEDRRVRDWFVAWLKANGFEVIIDAIGNVFGLLNFAGPGAPVVLTGSHFDSQPNGGRFDGAYGVIAAAQAALAIKMSVDSGHLKPVRNLCVVNWTNEEGARFQPSLLGSGVYAGLIRLEDALAIRDGEGATVADALATAGYAGAGQPPAAESYVELHIECGPELEATGHVIGVTENWWGALKMQISVTGERAHTGPTAMRRRKDALLGASLLIAGVRDMADRVNTADVERLYTSVGRIEVEPNSPNVVPGTVTLFVELRSSDPDVLIRAERSLSDLMKQVEACTGLPVTVLDSSMRDAGRFDPQLVALAWRAAERNGFPALKVATIAGHDAIPLAGVAKSVLVVTPSAGGICHHEDEFTKDDDLEAGLFVLTDMLRTLCSENAP